MGSLAWLSAWLLATLAADTVTVAVQPLDDRAAFAIVDACNRALDEIRCVVEGSPDTPAPATPSTPAPGMAGAAPPITRVRVALSSASLERAAVAFEAAGVLGVSRILEFDDTDPVEERYRAIGLVIASRLLEEQAAARGEPPPKPERTLSPRQKPAPKRFAFETALFIGQGLDEGNVRWGLRSRALARIVRDVPVSTLFGVRLGTAASSADQPDMRWIDLSLGLQGAVPLIGDSFALELHAEGALQFVTASLDDSGSGRSDDGSARRGGAIAGAQLAWTPFPFWALFIGGESSWFWPPLVLEVRLAEVAKEDPLRFSAHFGQRLSF